MTDTDRVIIEYQSIDAKRPPGLSTYPAAQVLVRFAAGIGLGGKQSLTETRQTLSDAGFELEHQSQIKRGDARHWTCWREVWKKDGIIREEENMHKTPQDKEREELTRMADGPYIAEDEHTIHIPRDWSKPAAARFWLNYGFRFNIKTNTWTRSSKKPLNGKIYQANAWLESTTKEFFVFWKDEIRTRSLARIQAEAEDHHKGNWR